MKRYKLLISCVLLFFICFQLGLLIAKNKPLWVDEIFSQANSINNLPYTRIIKGEVPEGNGYPLFYFIQKALCDLFQYETPGPWLKGDFDFKDMYSRVFLRLNPVFFMALSIVSIFYYFSRCYSILTGLYSLLISFLSYMFWAYYAEARPYALWVFLTTLQSLLFLYLLREDANENKGIKCLFFVNLLLSLTVSLSIGQIIIVPVLLYFLKNKIFKKDIFVFFVPVIISIIYYLKSHHCQFFFGFTTKQLINSSFSLERFLIMFMYLCVLIYSYFENRNIKSNIFDSKALRSAFPFFCLTVLVLAFNLLVILILKFKEVPQQGFVVSARYFIPLAPIGVISTTIFSAAIIKSLRKNSWIKWLSFCGIASLAIARFTVLFPYIKNGSFLFELGINNIR